MIRNPSRRMVKLIGAVLAMIWLTTVPTLEHTAAQQAPQRRYFQSTGSLAGLPFSDAVLVGNTLYVAGHIGVDDATGQAPADVDREVQLLLDRLPRDVLAQAGMKIDDLVSANVYCTDPFRCTTSSIRAIANNLPRIFPPERSLASPRCCAERISRWRAWP